MLDPQFPDSEKLLAAARPKIRERLLNAVKQLGPRLQRDGAPALMGLLLGGIIAPLATIGAGPIEQIITQIIGGVGGNLLAGFVQKFYDAPDDAAKQAVLAGLVQSLQAQSGQSEQILTALQQLLSRVDALAAVREAAGTDEAARLEQKFIWLRPIPADLPAHREFARAVKKLFQLKRSAIAEGFYLGGEQLADLLVTDVIHGEPLRTVVQCVTTKQGRADEEMLLKMLGWFQAAKSQNRFERGMIVTDAGLSPAAQGQAEGAGWKVRRYDDLLAGLMDFAVYLERRCDDFMKPRPESDLPALQEYYVPLKARDERASDKAQPFDLFGHAQKWIDRPSPAPPLMLLGEYGTGKTTFCRKLAFELAQSYRAAQDRVAAGQPLNGPRPRLPLLINLLDFVEIKKIDSLITHYLDKHCGVDRPRYELFEALNEAGFFVLILDGFDEMAVRVDSATVEKHLYQIEQLAKPPNSRVLLTGRPEFFMSRKELEHSLWPHGEMLANRFKNYEALRLQLWDDAQIQDFLNRLVPHLPNRVGAGKDYYERIQKIPGFFDDLAQRAVLLEMIAQTLPFFQPHIPLTRPNLYQLYLQKELERQRLKKGRELLLPDQTRFALLQELAAASYQTEGSGVTYAAAEPLVKTKLPAEEAASPTKTEQHTREFLGCSFLRPGPGDLFVFSHRSFRGYLAAKEILPRLLEGTAAAQKIDQDGVGFLAEMLEEKCSREFYRQQVEAALKKDGVPDWITKTKDGRFVSKLPSGLEVEMVYVPAGPFVLGAEGEHSLPPQIAILEKGFWMDKTPVTNEQYQHFLKANPKHPAPNVKDDWAKPYNWNGRDFPKGAEKHPVVLVSWNEAQAFCKWSGKVLPADLQWEKSARGIDGRRWPWGSAWDRDKCNSASWWAKKDLWEQKDWEDWRDNVFLKELSGKKIMTTPVSQFAKTESPYGCVDSAGNVWEWCADFYDEQKTMQLLRGGAWYVRLDYVACAIRYGVVPVDRNYFIGFRCART